MATTGPASTELKTAWEDYKNSPEFPAAWANRDKKLLDWLWTMFVRGYEAAGGKCRD
jgi:hypothetical protein